MQAKFDAILEAQAGAGPSARESAAATMHRGCRCSTLLVSRLVSSRPNEVTKEQGGRQASRSAGSRLTLAR